MSGTKKILFDWFSFLKYSFECSGEVPQDSNWAERPSFERNFLQVRADIIAGCTLNTRETKNFVIIKFKREFKKS